MSEVVLRTKEEIAKANDLFRSTLINSKRHRVVLTEGVFNFKETNPLEFEELITKVRNFKDFNNSNNPHEENDFGRVTVGKTHFYWKIDYYDTSFNFGADPKTEEVYCLVLTLMLMDEY